MYRSPSQNNDQFDKFLYSLEDIINEITLSNPLFYIIFGHFNARSPIWRVDEKTSIEDTQFDALSSFHGQR